MSDVEQVWEAYRARAEASPSPRGPASEREAQRTLQAARLQARWVDANEGARQAAEAQMRLVAQQVAEAQLAEARAPWQLQPQAQAEVLRLVQCVAELEARIRGLEAEQQALTQAHARLVDLVYEVLTVRPCHQPRHEEQHLRGPTLCAEQAPPMLRVLLSGLVLTDRDLPRDVHRDADGRPLRCCQRGSKIAVWLRTGQYRSPTLRPSRMPPGTINAAVDILGEGGP